MSQIVPLGAAVYGSFILVLEGEGRMFWAIAQREKDIEKGRQEGRAELIRQLVEQNVDLPPEILNEVNGIDRGHSQT